MRTHLQVRTDCSTPAAADRPVLYDPVFDEYRLVAVGLMADRAVILRCPWCGVVLPSSRRDQWFDELAQLGISPDDPLLPGRFRSDAWWNTERPQPC